MEVYPQTDRISGRQSFPALNSSMGVFKGAAVCIRKKPYRGVIPGGLISNVAS